MSSPTRKDKAIRRARLMGIPTHDKTAAQLEEEADRAERALEDYLKTSRSRTVNVEIHVTIQVPENIQTKEELLKYLKTLYAGFDSVAPAGGRLWRRWWGYTKGEE